MTDVKNSKKPDVPAYERRRSDDRPFSFNDDVLKLFKISQSRVESFDVHSEKDELHVRIRLKKAECPCPVCRSRDSVIKGYRLKKIRHSVLTHVPCIIDYEQRRYRCRNCGRTFNEENPFTHPGEKVSAVTVLMVLQDLRRPNETFTSVAKRYFLSPTTVERIFDAHVNIPRGKLTRYMVMDETYAFHSITGDYIYVLMDFETLSVIDILPSRKKDVLDHYFGAIPRDERDQVLMTCSDMWDTYRQISSIYFRNGCHVVDSFHLKQELSRAVQQVRIRVMKKFHVTRKTDEEIRKMDPADAEEYEKNCRRYYLLKKFSWMLYKRPDDDRYFDPNRKKKYNKVFRQYLNYYDIYYMILSIDDELREAVALQEKVYDFYRNNDLKTAAKALKELTVLFRTSQIREMNKFAGTLANWKKEILNYFVPVQTGDRIISDDELSHAESELIRNFIAKTRRKQMKHMNSSLIENRNSTIKLIKKCANGYTNWQRFRNRVLYCLGKDTTFFLDPQPISPDRINEKAPRSK